MKLKFIFISLFGLTASCLISAAQTAATAAGNPPPAVTLAASPAPAETAATASPAPGAGAQDVGATNVAPDTAATTSTNAGQRDPNAIMPLIQMKDALLTDAIENLARQAGLNYILDPKIPYLSTGPDRVPQPTVSLRWENLTADQALNAVLDNFNLVIVDNPKTHISRITVKDPTAPDPLITKTIQLKDADPTNMLASVQSILMDKRSKVVADVRTSQLVLTGTEKEITSVDELVSRLDTQTKQVLIEAKLVELSKNPTSNHGFDWSGTFQAQHFGFGNNVAGGQSGNPYSTSLTQGPLLGFGPTQPNPPGTPGVITNGILNTFTYGPNNLLQNPSLLVDTAKGFNPTTAFLDADGLSAVLSFLNTDADAKILSTPRTVTLDNQEAILSVTSAQPIFLTTAGTQGSPGGSQVTYTNLGTILRVTPRISANNTINLRVIPEVSDLAGTITKTVAGLVNQADVFDIRRIDTRVLIPSGNTLVMGGLLNDNSTQGNTKVPILGDIPGLGMLFRSESKTQNKKNLIVFVTPTIVEPDSFQPSRSGAEFLQTRADDRPTADFGAWDSGKPQDWSKLFGKKSPGDSTQYPDAGGK